MPPVMPSLTPAASSPRPVDVRPPAGREHDLIDDDLVVAGELHAQPVIDLRDALDDLLGDDLDAALLHLGAQMRAQIVVEAAQDVVAAIDQRHLRAETVEDAGELDRDIAAALDQDALRQLLEMKRLVRGDHVLVAFDLLAERRRGAGRDQDIFGPHDRAVSDEPHSVSVDDLARGSCTIATLDRSRLVV